MKKLGIIGLGNMGGAIAQGLVPSKTLEILGFDPALATQTKMAHIMTVLPSGQDVAQQADILLLAIKPQLMRQVLTSLAPHLRPETCLVSIAAGITLKQLVEWSGQICPVVRIMPNTPALVGQGVYALCFDHELLTEAHKESILQIFTSIGQAHVLPESLFDAYTGLIGCGPAYVFAFMEGLIDAGVTLGLTRGQATQMVKGLILGSAHMAEAKDAHPTLLKEMVTSPGGATITGLNTLDEHRFKFAISQAVHTAAQKSKKLGD